MITPFFMLNRDAASDDYAACLINRGQLRTTALPLNTLASANEWSSEWDKQAKVIDLSRLDRMEGLETENAALKLTYRDDRGKRHTLTLACADLAGRAQMIEAIEAHSGEVWSGTKAINSRSAEVGKGFLLMVGIWVVTLFAALPIYALANGDFSLKQTWLHAWLHVETHRYGIKGAILPAMLWFVEMAEQPIGRVIAYVIAGLGALLGTLFFSFSFFWPLDRRFIYSRST